MYHHFEKIQNNLKYLNLFNSLSILSISSISSIKSIHRLLWLSLYTEECWYTLLTNLTLLDCSWKWVLSLLIIPRNL